MSIAGGHTRIAAAPAARTDKRDGHRSPHNWWRKEPFKYCTPCHGPAGAPGTAVYADTRKPVDLRNYVQRNGGKFPAARWIAVVTTDNPTQLHTEVWYRIRDAQGGAAFADAGGRAVVASIASYIRSIQE